MPDHENARKQLVAAQRNMDLVSKIPEEENFRTGSMIRWKHRGSTEPGAAIKTGELWMRAGQNGRFTWRQVVQVIAQADLEYLETSTGWGDITVVPPPVETLSPEHSGYEGLILRDPRRNIAWELRGTEWVRVYEE